MFYTIQLLEFFWQCLSWPTTILKDFLHVLASLGHLQIDVEVLVVEELLVKVVHIHVAAAAQHVELLPAPHVMDHGAKLHLQPLAI